VHVVLGLLIMLVAFAAGDRLGRWAGASKKIFPPDLLRMFIFFTVGFGAFMGGLYYTETGSARRSFEGAVIAGLGFGVLMTGFFAVVLGSWWLFSPGKYAFLKAWTEAHVEHGVKLSARLRGGRQRGAVSRQFRERWEREDSPLSAKEFINSHWEEILAAEATATGL